MIELKTIVIHKTDKMDLYHEKPKSFLRNERSTDQYKDNRIRIDSSGRFMYNLVVVDDIFISQGLKPSLYYRAFVLGTNKLCDHYEMVKAPKNYSNKQCKLNVKESNIRVIGL